MKKTILPALAMLIVAAVMLSTASYAWFAMGATVTAENMNVSVKSDSAYLVILKDTELDANIDGNGNIKSGFTQQSVDFDAAAKELYPVAFDAASGLTDASFKTDTIWYTMEGTDSADGTGKAGSKETVAYADALNDYVLLSTVYIATSVGSENMSNLKALVNIDGDDAINVVVVTSTAYELFSESSANYGAVTLAGTVTNVPVKVDIYVYYDGNDTTITTDQFGLQKILDTSVTVSFKAE